MWACDLWGISERKVNTSKLCSIDLYVILGSQCKEMKQHVIYIGLCGLGVW